jgi:prepilin-type N-terminal cleavage/methylation domain-containing protein
MRQKQGFTLIELLIVVAIIAILAAIAVPNFLEAQVRSKVSRVKTDMRSLATAIEAYAVDNKSHPSSKVPRHMVQVGTSAYSGRSVFNPGVTSAVSPRFIWLTSPVAYISSVFTDPFVIMGKVKNPGGIADPQYDCYDYIMAKDFWNPPTEQRGSGITSGAMWRLCSAGPDGMICYGGGTRSQVNANPEWKKGVDYDPTNGTVSPGDIVRIGGGPFSYNPTDPPAFDRIQNTINF